MNRLYPRSGERQREEVRLMSPSLCRFRISGRSIFETLKSY